MCTLWVETARGRLSEVWQEGGLQTMKGYYGLGSEVIFPFVAKIWMKSIHLDVLLLENETQEISYHEFPRTFKKIDNYPSGTL